MKTQYHPRPFREQIGSREIQRDIDLMRAIYARRGPLNYQRGIHRLHPMRWIAYGIGIGAIIAGIACF